MEPGGSEMERELSERGEPDLELCRLPDLYPDLYPERGVSQQFLQPIGSTGFHQLLTH